MDQTDEGDGAGGHDAYHADRFEERVRLATARERLVAALDPVDRTLVRATAEADGDVLATAVTAERDVPGYERAAMDGYAVRGADTSDATPETPATLDLSEGRVGSGGASPVNTGGELPEGADAVVRVERTDREGSRLLVRTAVDPGTNVAPRDEDVRAGQRLYEAGHRLRPPDLGLLRAVGTREVEVRDRPRVSVLPTGEELVETAPGPGEVVETNGLTVARYVERWGGDPSYRESVTDDRAALRTAIERDLDHDVVVTTGGSSVGRRDLLPDVLAARGEVVVHGVAIKPGHPVGFGVVDGVLVLMLPGYPVSTIVTALQLLRPAVAVLAGRDPSPLPYREARLAEGVESDPDTRTFERVRVWRPDGDPDGDRLDVEWEAEPVRAAGAGVLSSGARADGWVEVPEERTTVRAGETVQVQDWDWQL